eukprot:2975965-Pleurochrysis_carterae.AAC.1
MPNPNFPVGARPSQLSFFSSYFSSQQLNPAATTLLSSSAPSMMMGMLPGLHQTYLSAAAAAMKASESRRQSIRARI